jgi:hypothetical protein
MTGAFHVRWYFPNNPSIPLAGYYVVDPQGVITYQVFGEVEHGNPGRSTPLGLLAKLFPDTLTLGDQELDATHAKIELTQSDLEARWGSRIVLRVGMDIPKGFHTYAPDVTGGYRPIKLEIAETPSYTPTHRVDFPKARVISIPDLGENLPVFEGKFGFTTEVGIKWPEFERANKDQKSHDLQIKGNLSYQICNDKICFPPETTPVSWTLHVMADRNPELKY